MMSPDGCLVCLLSNNNCIINKRSNWFIFEHFNLNIYIQGKCTYYIEVMVILKG